MEYYLMAFTLPAKTEATRRFWTEEWHDLTFVKIPLAQNRLYGLKEISSEAIAKLEVRDAGE